MPNPKGYNGWTGIKENPGPPTLTERDYQKSARAIFQDCASPEDVHNLASATIKDAINGDADARRLIWPYIFGPAPKVPDIDNSDNRTINVFKFPDWWQPPQLPEPPADVLQTPKT